MQNKSNYTMACGYLAILSILTDVNYESNIVQTSIVPHLEGVIDPSNMDAFTRFLQPLVLEPVWLESLAIKQAHALDPDNHKY